MSDKVIKTRTGIGGFEIDGKIHDLDVGDPTAKGLVPVPVDHGDMDVDNNTKDISKDTKKTLAQYLSDLTLGKEGTTNGIPNDYPIDPPPEIPQEISLLDNKGNPTPPSPTTNSAHFADSNEINSYTDHYPDLSEHSNKGKSSVTGVDGNELLSSINKKTSGLVVKKYVDSILVDNDFSDKNQAADLPDLTSPPPGFDVNPFVVNHNLGSSEGDEELPLKKRIGKASDETSGKGSAKIANDYPVSNNQTSIETTDSKTYVPVPLADQPKDQRVYVPRDKVVGGFIDVPADKRPIGPGNIAFDGSAYARPIKIIADPVADSKFNENISKGKESPQRDDGNSLLSSVAKDKLPDVIDKYTSSVLRNNRFDTAARSAGGTDLDHVSSKYNPMLVIPGEGLVSTMKMAQIGAALSLRASGEFPAAFSDKFDPSSAASSIGSLIPSPNQLGILKVNTMLLEAKDVLDHLSSEDVDVDSLSNISPFGGDSTGQSWGNLNNVEEPFAGTMNLGQVALALALTVAVTLVFEALGLLFSSGGGPLPRSKRNIFQLGSSVVKENVDPNGLGFPPDFSVLLGIRPTLFPFLDAVKTGVVAFFLGAQHITKGLGGQLLAAGASALSSATNDVSAAGANIVAARTIVRSGLAIAEGFSKIAKAFASNPISGIKSIFGIIDIIKHSKMFAAMNIFSTIGDALLSQPWKEIDVIRTTADAEGKLIASRIDFVDENSNRATISKNRLNKTTKLAWSSNRAPALYLIPDSTSTMMMLDNQGKLGSFKGTLGLSDEKARTYSQVKKNGERISRSSDTKDENTVKKIESLLDGEYVPFYFHDLRTNEIISFHAFLTSLTEDYAAAWESIDGYGRVDPIKIYKSTSRKISLSFYSVAVDDKDFDDMWVKLNKLITLVYPQYTRGKLLTNSEGPISFVQPFSQMIGASPIIRLRLGDLLRSNYSKFALARLFGADTVPMKLKTKEVNFSGGTSTSEEQLQKLSAYLKSLITSPLVNHPYYLTSITGGRLVPASSLLPLSFPTPVSAAPELKIDADDLKYFDFKIEKSPDSDGLVHVRVLKPTAAKITERHSMSSEAATLKANECVIKYGDSANNIQQCVIDSIYAISRNSLQLTPKLEQEAYKLAELSLEGIGDIDTLSEFLDENKNALVKSFNSVKGKGLAGVIESINIDWYDKVQWEIDPSRTAPKMCKISISFTPIHDISPGIDSNGYNRAPVYPVGYAMGSTNEPGEGG